MEAGAFDAWLAGAGDSASATTTAVAYPRVGGDPDRRVDLDPRLRGGTENVTRGASTGTGAALYASYGCQGCHAIRGAGGRIGPDLTLLPERRSLAAASLPLTPAALAGFVRDPVATKAGVLMPSFPAMTQAESAAIAAYLLEPK